MQVHVLGGAEEETWERFIDAMSNAALFKILRCV